MKMKTTLPRIITLLQRKLAKILFAVIMASSIRTLERILFDISQ